MSPLTDTERLELRRLIARTSRAILALFTFEFLSALLHIAIPEPHAVVSDLSAVIRVSFTTLLVLAAFGLAPVCRGLTLFTRSALGLLIISAIFTLAPFFDIVPLALGDRLWDALLAILRITTLLGALALLLLTAHRMAARLRSLDPGPLRSTPLAFALAYPVFLASIEPATLPHPLIAPAFALALPLVLAATRVLDRLSAAGLALLALAPLALHFTDLLAPSALPALAVTALTLAVALPPRLHALTAALSGRSTTGPSPSFIRRIIGAPVGPPDQRVEDHPDSSSASNATDGSLDLAYRELGLASHSPPSPSPASDNALETAAVLPFIPKTRPQTAPRLDLPGEVVAPPTSSPRAQAEGLALRLISRSLLARGLLTAFGVVLSASPLALFPPALLVFDLALLVCSVATLRGLFALRSLTERPLLPHLALALGALLATADLALVVARLADLPRLPLLITSAAALIGTLSALLLGLGQVFSAGGETKLSARAGQAIALLLGLGTALAAFAIISALDASDLVWLAWPIGLVASALGLGLWISLLWLLKDAIDVIAPSGLDEA
jgi:hypothetical protein